MKKTITYSIIFLLVMSFCTIGVTLATDSGSSLKEKEQQLQEGKKKEKELTGEISELEASIAKSEKELASINNEVTNIQSRISEKETELAEIEREIESQHEDLNARLRVMYKNGQTGLIEVLLGSTSMTDFMSNLEMVKTIHNTDVKILAKMEEQQKIVAEQEKELKTLQADMAAKQKQQASIQSALEADKKQVAAARGEVSAENDQLEADIAALYKVAAASAASESKNLDYSKSYSGGKMSWPVPGYSTISSGFGYRTHPVTGAKGSMHTGIDIPCPIGTTVVAGESGTVIKTVSSGGSSGYGTYLIIDHGSGISTLYAHNSRLLVSVGQSVSRGQAIAKSGNTGRSTGPHLHFEVRNGASFVNPTSWL